MKLSFETYVHLTSVCMILVFFYLVVGRLLSSLLDGRERRKPSTDLVQGRHVCTVDIIPDGTGFILRPSGAIVANQVILVRYKGELVGEFSKKEGGEA